MRRKLFLPSGVRESVKRVSAEIVIRRGVLKPFSKGLPATGVFEACVMVGRQKGARAVNCGVGSNPRKAVAAAFRAYAGAVSARPGVFAGLHRRKKCPRK